MSHRRRNARQLAEKGKPLVVAECPCGKSALVNGQAEADAWLADHRRADHGQE